MCAAHLQFGKTLDDMEMELRSVQKMRSEYMSWK